MLYSAFTLQRYNKKSIYAKKRCKNLFFRTNYLVCLVRFVKKVLLFLRFVILFCIIQNCTFTGVNLR